MKVELTQEQIRFIKESLSYSRDKIGNYDYSFSGKDK
jgi:hypothetical protein